MEEERREAAALNVGAPGGAERDAGSSCCCNLCGDVGFREALLPCGARGCSRLQHTYCGRYCPEVAGDAGRWRCEWCAREDGGYKVVEDEEDSSRKRSRRTPPSSSPKIKKASPERPTDKERRSAGHREEKREQHAPRPTSPGDGARGSMETSLVHRERESINTGAGGGGGGSSKALDRWKNLAKRTRLGGKKYKLLADVLC